MRLLEVQSLISPMSIFVVLPLDVSDTLQVLDSNSSRNEQEAGCLGVGLLRMFAWFLEIFATIRRIGDFPAQSLLNSHTSMQI